MSIASFKSKSYNVLKLNFERNKETANVTSYLNAVLTHIYIVNVQETSDKWIVTKHDPAGNGPDSGISYQFNLI